MRFVPTFIVQNSKVEAINPLKLHISQHRLTVETAALCLALSVRSLFVCRRRGTQTRERTKGMSIERLIKLLAVNESKNSGRFLFVFGEKLADIS